MYLTVKHYESDGRQIEFAVPMAYIKKEYVRVFSQALEEGGFHYGERRELTFTWVNAGLIRLSQAVPAGERIAIRRETYADSPLVDYQNAAILVEEDLDLAALQALHVAQEAREQNGSDIAETASGLVTTVETVREAANSTIQAAAGAQAALAECRESASATGQAAEGMAEIRREVLGAADTFSREYANAVTIVAGVDGSLELAEASRIQAESAAATATASATDGKNAAAEARRWATEAEDVPVLTGAFSAKHWAVKADKYVEKAMAWAENPPGISVEVGKYSARHYADQASATGDLGGHIGAENPHPQYLRADQNGSAFFEVDAGGDISMRENVQTAAMDMLFHLDAVADVALNA